RPPNNWKAIIGGSAWEWCEARQQFYLHQFLPCQPDLNWWNPAVQEAMLGHLKFWLDKGVDGFRLDIIHTLFEDKNFRDNPMSRRLFPNKNTNAFLFQKPKYTQFLPETIAICKELRKIVDSYSPPRMLVGEAVGNPELYKPLYGKNNNGLHLVFNFAFGEKPFSAQEFRKGLLQSERLLPEPFWPCYVFSNHDSVRMISRYGNNPLKARLITMLLLTIRGTPFIYMGEEIGMRQVSVPRKQQKDPIAFHRLYGIPIGRFFGRDGCRTPFQWTASPLNAGFSQDPTVSPWLPVHENCSKINVQDQLGKENSMLTYYQQLLQLRKKHPALQTGTLTILPEKRKHLLTYTRNHKKETLVILLNFSTQQKHVPLFSEKYQFIFSSQFSGKPTQIEKQVILLPFEGKIMQKLVV
ncbi:MAG: alpha-amylase family glycosyl hydrolase, partial [Asgard group archaeon]|nr:alpha-amylase family glycosyl hydrolase [Asgard group archaeon]